MRALIKYTMIAIAALAVSAGALQRAHAEEGAYGKDNWPLQVILRPVTLGAGMLEIRGDTMRLNLSSDMVAEPVSFAPDIYYGVNDKLSVGLTHDTGICITGTDGGCAKSYNDVGLDALYALMRAGTFQAAFHGGLKMPSLSDPFIMGLNLGLLARLQVSNVAVVFDPTIYVGIAERDTLKEYVWIPIDLQYQINPQTMVYLRSGMNGPLDGFGDAYQIPIGLGTSLAFNERFDVGAEFSFANLAGKNHSADERWLLVRAALRL